MMRKHIKWITFIFDSQWADANCGCTLTSHFRMTRKHIKLMTFISDSLPVSRHKLWTYTYLWLQDEAYKLKTVYLWLPASEQTQTVDVHFTFDFRLRRRDKLGGIFFGQLPQQQIDTLSLEHGAGLFLLLLFLLLLLLFFFCTQPSNIHSWPLLLRYIWDHPLRQVVQTKCIWTHALNCTDTRPLIIVSGNSLGRCFVWHYNGTWTVCRLVYEVCLHAGADWLKYFCERMAMRFCRDITQNQETALFLVKVTPALNVPCICLVSLRYSV